MPNSDIHNKIKFISGVRSVSCAHAGAQKYEYVVGKLSDYLNSASWLSLVASSSVTQPFMPFSKESPIVGNFWQFFWHWNREYASLGL